jgi:3-deoxy-D-manno-octulosonic-acid transferase/heptosyltransferase-1
MEILIIKLSAIGDVIHTLPALDALHQRFPESNISWLVEEKASGILKDHPYLKKIIVSQRKKWINNFKHPSLWYSSVKEMKHFIEELRSQRYNVIIDFQGLLKSGILVWLARGERKIGYDSTREMSGLFLNERVPPLSSRHHAVAKNVNLARYVGAEAMGVRSPIFISEEDKEQVQRLLAAHDISSSKPLVVLHTQAGWRTKEWEPMKVAELSGKLIARYDAQLIFTGSRDDHTTVETIISMVGHPAVNASGKTSLTQLAYLLSLSDLMITVDSGPMHLASAMGTPLVALFGPTASWRTGPYGSSAQVIASPLSCSPCFKRACESKTCMKGITVDEVLEAVDVQLRKRGKRSIREGRVQ